MFQTNLKDLKIQDFSKEGDRTNGRWTKEEHFKFLEGLRIHGKNWKKIEELVITRTGSQIRSHAQKFFLKAQKLYPSNISQSENITPELQENQQTVISKAVSENTSKMQDCSYFMGKIFEYTYEQNHFDFWFALVDQKDNKTNSSSEYLRKNSFVAIQDQENTEIKINQTEKIL